VIEIERLPHPLAVALRGHALEERPFVRAWRLCEAMEMLTRFLTATALAEIAAGAGEAGFPPALRRVMTNGLGRPTFGAWAAILREAGAALPPSSGMLVPELGDVLAEVLDVIGLPTDPVETKILSLRNALAHDWFPDDQVQQLLGEHGHEARFQTLWSGRVATLLGGLQSAGYVTRTPGADSAGDRRTVSLDLSEAGTEAVTRWHRVNEDIIQAALADLPHRDRAALRDAAPALRDLTASIDAQAD